MTTEEQKSDIYAANDCLVIFRSLHHAKAAWDTIKVILENSHHRPDQGGLLMETMTDIATGMDHQLKKIEVK